MSNKPAQSDAGRRAFSGALPAFTSPALFAPRG